MGLAVTTIAPTTALTTAARMRAAGLAFPTADEGDIDRIIASASAAIVNYCGRPFAREDVTEQCPGFGDVHLALTRSPILSVASVSSAQVLIADFSIAHRDQALLYRSAGWGWTVAHYAGLGVGSAAFGDSFMFRPGTPLPNQEAPQFTVEYIAGYILPPQYLDDSGTISVDASDQSFNSTALEFPDLLQPNDVLVSSGFTNPANNGRFKVVGTPTRSKVKIDGVLLDEAAGADRSIRFEPPADCRPFDDVERACFEATKSWYSSRGRESALVERQMSSTRVRWSEQDVARSLGLPPSCIGLLASWRRLT